MEGGGAYLVPDALPDEVVEGPAGLPGPALGELGGGHPQAGGGVLY